MVLDASALPALPGRAGDNKGAFSALLRARATITAGMVYLARLYSGHLLVVTPHCSRRLFGS